MELTRFDYGDFPSQFARTSQRRADKVRDLDKQTGKNVFEMGKVLQEQREAFGTLEEKSSLRGSDTWNAWVQSEFGWVHGQRYANRLIKIYKKFGRGAESAPPLGFEVMRQLATDSTPQELVDQVVEMAKKGGLPSIKQVKEMKKSATNNLRPTPTDAKTKARETGEPVIGSDNKIYTPLPEDDVEEYQERRDRTYNTMDAVGHISNIEISPEQWLSEAEPHWLSDFNLGSVEQAADWLSSLAKIYKEKEDIVDGK